MYTRVKTSAEIEAMRKGGAILADVLRKLKAQVRIGMSTKNLADMAAKELRKHGAEPAFLGFQGFPEVMCISVNDEVVHGIPRSGVILKKGDIVSLDIGVRYKGMIVDGAVSVVCGEGNEPKDKLLQYTEASLLEGIESIRGGCRTGDIGFAIQKVLAKHGLGIVQDLVGHGVGHSIHEEPNIPNYGKKNTGAVLMPGMTVAIEPMATLGKEAVYTDSDGWTIKTKDGSLAAHFEHTVLVTEGGCEVLTA
jgi:methionyl aminopeptidase